MKTGITQVGRDNFGRWILESRSDPDVVAKIKKYISDINPAESVSETATQDQLARWISFSSGFDHSYSLISRIERGGAPPLAFLIAVTIDMQLLRLADGSYPTIEQAIGVLTEKVDPFGGKKPEKNGSKNGRGRKNGALR